MIDEKFTLVDENGTEAEPEPNKVLCDDGLNWSCMTKHCNKKECQYYGW